MIEAEVKFDRMLMFLGRNGWFNCAGLSVFAGTTFRRNESLPDVQAGNEPETILDSLKIDRTPRVEDAVAGEIRIRPLTSRDEPGRCEIQIPLEHADAALAMLADVAEKLKEEVAAQRLKMRTLKEKEDAQRHDVSMHAGSDDP